MKPTEETEVKWPNGKELNNQDFHMLEEQSEGDGRISLFGECGSDSNNNKNRNILTPGLYKQSNSQPVVLEMGALLGDRFIPLRGD